MNQYLSIIFVSGLVLAASVSRAGSYVGVSYSQFDYKKSDYDKASSVKPSTPIVRAGFVVNPNVSFETRALFRSSTAESAQIADHKANVEPDFELSRVLGLYLKAVNPYCSESCWIKPYLLFGMTHVKAEAMTGGANVSSKQSASYGAGFSVPLDKNLQFTGEYANLYEKDSVEVSTIMFGLNFDL